MQVEGTNGTRGARMAKRPRDGRAYLALLVGGYKNTQHEITERLKRYGIKVRYHAGPEQKANPNFIVYPDVELVVFLIDDVADVLLRRVLTQGAKFNPPLDNVGIHRKRPGEWDLTFKAAGYPPNPSWSDGFDVILPPEPAPAPPKPAYEDPVFKPATIADVLIAGREQLMTPESSLRPVVVPSPPPAPVETQPAAPVAPETKVPMAKPNSSPWKGKSIPGLYVEPTTDFGKALRRARERDGLSQGGLGEALNVGQNNVSGWERGATVPKYEAWLRIHERYPHIRKPEGVRGEKTYKAVRPDTTPPKPKKDHNHARNARNAAARAERERLALTQAQGKEKLMKPDKAKKVSLTPQAIEDDATDEYVAVLAALSACNREIRQAQERRTELLAKLKELHEQVVG